MKTATLLAATALLAACTTPAGTHWTKAGATQHDYENDYDACRARAAALPEAPRAAGVQQTPRDIPGAAIAGGGTLHPDFIEACLRERGWELR